MSILSHAWGVSPAADRVWCQVVGMRTIEAARKPFMVLQAFIDDSTDEQSGTFALAGYIATAEGWAAFSEEWERELPHAVRDKKGFYFKMSRMAQFPDRLAATERFCRIIERHVAFAISITANKKDMIRARNRIMVPGVNIDWDRFGNAYMVLFRCLMDKFHNERLSFDLLQKLIPLDQRIDFIFDDQTEKKFIQPLWFEYLEGKENDLRAIYGTRPRFESDREFLPLQAADFWVWWVRKWAQDGVIKERILDRDFGGWRGYAGIPSISITLDEDDHYANFEGAVREHLQPGQFVVDLGQSDFRRPSLKLETTLSIADSPSAWLSSPAASKSRTAFRNRSDWSGSVSGGLFGFLSVIPTHQPFHR